MRKIALFLVIILLYGSNVLAIDYKVTGSISGVVEDVEIHLASSILSSSFTVIKFQDGRVISFRGITVGLIIEKGKCQLFEYNDDWNILSVKKCGDTRMIGK